MKVYELIEALKEMPQDAEVICCSDANCFEVENTKVKENKIYIGHIEEAYPFSAAEIYEEYKNYEGKLKEFWNIIPYCTGIWHDNANGNRIMISCDKKYVCEEASILFEIIENGNEYYPTDLATVRAFIEKYIDFLMDGEDCVG